MFQDDGSLLGTHGYPIVGMLMGDKSSLVLSKDFERFLGRHMESLGLSVAKEPVLPNGRTPDFCVEFEGVKCYVEATSRPEIEYQILDAFEGFGRKPYTLFISVLQSREKVHLNARRKTAAGIIRWVDSFINDFKIDDTESLAARERFPARTFERDGYCWTVKSLVHFSAREMDEIDRRPGGGGLSFRVPVGWPVVDPVLKIGAASPCKEDVMSIRNALRGKAVRYLPIPDGIGDVPLVIAISDYGHNAVVDELLGVRTLPFSGGLPSSLIRQDSGFWRRSTQSKRHHVKAVWHFDRARSDNSDFTAKLILNPDEENARAILPAPLFSDPHTEIVSLR